MSLSPAFFFLFFPSKRKQPRQERTDRCRGAPRSPPVCSLKREAGETESWFSASVTPWLDPGSRGAEQASSLAGRGHRRDAGDLGGVVGPRLQVLQGEERRVVHAERVGGQGLCQTLLEGLLLQLQEDAVRLLPLSLTLLGGLPPAPGTSRYRPFACAPGK